MAGACIFLVLQDIDMVVSVSKMNVCNEGHGTICHHTSTPLPSRKPSNHDYPSAQEPRSLPPRYESLAHRILLSSRTCRPATFGPMPISQPCTQMRHHPDPNPAPSLATSQPAHQQTCFSITSSSTASFPTAPSLQLPPHTHQTMPAARTNTTTHTPRTPQPPPHSPSPSPTPPQPPPSAPPARPSPPAASFTSAPTGMRSTTSTCGLCRGGGKSD